MHLSRPLWRCICALLVALFCVTPFAPAEEQPIKTAKFPFPEKLFYHIEWRFIMAGSLTVDLARDGGENWQINLHLESAGVVSRLYQLVDNYKALSDGKFCSATVFLDNKEAKRHTTTRLTFDNSRHKVEYEESDLVKNSTQKKELDIAPCTYDITAALASLRAMQLPPGKWGTFPITDGRKMAHAKIEAQAKETVNIAGKNYSTIRYEAFVFDDVLYKRRGRLLIWMTDDSERVPVQFRLLMGFPIGTITAQLDKQQKN